MSAAMPTMRPVLYLRGTIVTVPVSVSGVFDARFRYSIVMENLGPDDRGTAARPYRSVGLLVELGREGLQLRIRGDHPEVLVGDESLHVRCLRQRADLDHELGDLAQPFVHLRAAAAAAVHDPELLVEEEHRP